ncbi:MAG: outer membrane biosynthesis protein TonB [Bacteroidia bacterium]|jgi:outer membrane biosynthesis protein TonB
MDLAEKKNKRKAMITSLSIHALLLLLFLFFGLTTIHPKPEEGMMINFGNTDMGLGDTESDPAQSEVVEEQVEEEVQPAESVATPSDPVVEEQVVTQDMLDAIALKEEQKRKQKIEAEERAEEERIASKKARVEEEKRAASAALFKKAKDGQGTGEGDTQPGGNQGSAGGTPGAPHGLGGSGDGMSFNLGGRNMVSAPKIVDTSQKEGKVVVDIIVDKYGKVVKATPGGRGSTTTDRHLEKLATEAAYNTKFNAKADASIQQKGSMTFVFILE